MADFKLTPEVAGILSNATIEGTNLYLPPTQLDRKLYDAVNKALENLGGKWNKKAKAHVFASDPVSRLAAALGTGIASDDDNEGLNARKEKKLYQAFFTPSELARQIVAVADVNGARVLEPSAGLGALADACDEAGASIVNCIEINPEFVATLKAKGYSVTEGDFLQMATNRLYHRIVMNPPFTKNQDIAHVEHALRWLAPGGVLVAIMGGSTQRPGFVDLIERTGAEVRPLPEGAFKESGTNVATVLVTINA